MIDASNVILSNGINVNDYIGHLSNVDLMNRSNNLMLCMFNYSDVSFSEADTWVNPSSFDFSTHGNIADDDIAKIVTIGNQKILALSPDYWFIVITTFASTYIQQDAECGVLLAFDYWMNGSKASVPYVQKTHVLQGKQLGTTRAYAETKIDVRTLTPNTSINGYLPAFKATNSPTPATISNITQFVLAVNSRMK